MSTLLNPCRVCGKDVPSDAAGGQCSYCLLQIGLSSAGGGQSSRGGRTTLGGGGGAVAERFIRQGIQPLFGDYELEAEIARGGMGVVYRARQRSLNRVVAIKMILAGQLATAESVQRFRLEAQAAARLQHPGIVPIYEIGECETHHYFSMELIEGPSLSECLDDFRLKAEAGFSERRQQEQCIAELIGRVARALDFAHQRGVLHRDLKPSNILIDERGHPRLTDFGLAKLTGREAAGLTLATAVLGTPGYLAPEQAAGLEHEVTTAADVYGLGATLYELLTGSPPFVGSTALSTMMMAIDRAPAPPRQINPAVHRDLETIVLRCLEKAPQRRYRSAAAVADELERFTRGEPIDARPVGRAEQVLRWCRRNPTLAAVLCVLVGAIVGGGSAVFWQWRRAERANVALGHANIAMERANVSLTQTVSDLKWGAIDDLLQQGQSSRALATVASLIRDQPNDADAAMFAMSVLEQRRFPVPAAPTIRHLGGAELSVAGLSPDGRRIVTASFDGTARIWDSATSQELVPPLKHDAAVTWAEFNPDGRSLATCSADKTVRFWDAQTGRPLGEPIRIDEPVISVHFSPDGRYLLTRTKLIVCILDARSGHMVIGPILHDGPVVAAKFLSGGASFFTAQNADGKSSVRAWEIATGRDRGSLSTGPLLDADVSDDTNRVAIVSQGRGSVTDFPSGAGRTEIVTTNGTIQRVIFSPRGDRIAAIGQNHWARVFDAQTGKPVTSELPHYYLLTGASFFRNGHELLTWGMDALAQAWDIDANRPYCEPMRHEDRVAYAEVAAPSGGEIFLTTQSHPRSRSADSRTGAARLWKVLDRQNPDDRIFGVDHSFDGSKLSPDGRLLALGWSIDRKVRVLDTATGKLVCGPLPMKGGAWGLLFTPDGSRLISTTSGGEVAVWSIPGGKLVADPVLLGTAILPAEISRDGRMFATGSNDGIVRLWDPPTGRPIREMRHGAVIRSLAFSPDGQLLASAGADRIARVWRTSDGSPFHELAGHQNDVMTVFFSPDGRRLVTGSLDFTARIWDTASGRSLAVLPHQGDVLDVAYSPDGHYVATASRDRTAVIWDAATGLPHSRSLLHEQAVRNVRFSPDGRRLFTLEFHGLRAWDVATGHPLTVRLPHQMQGGTAFQTSATRFDYLPDGSALLVGEDSARARLWHLSDPPAGAPPWFAQFLEAVAGERITGGSDRPEIVPPERFLDLAKQIQRSTSSDYYSRWARRWLVGAKPPLDTPAVDP